MVSSRLLFTLLASVAITVAGACDPGDADGDGHRALDAGGDDCDDSDPSTFPGGVDWCDAIDNDCNGAVDDAQEVPYDGIDNDCDGSDANDLDGDGYVAVEAHGNDCDDTSPRAHPGWRVPDPAERLSSALATDVVDGIDNDCDGMADEGPFSVRFAADIQPVFTANCTASQCHHSPTGPLGLELDEGHAYSKLVGHAAAESNLNRVEPLDPLASYLWYKINDMQDLVGGGDSMPLDRPLLPEESRDLIYLWILEGCGN